MRQGADARQADGELAVVGVGQTDAGGLHQQAKLLGVRRGTCRLRLRLDLQQGSEVVAGQHSLVERPGCQPDAQLRARPERASSTVTGSAKWPGNVTRRPTRPRREAATDDSMQGNDSPAAVSVFSRMTGDARIRLERIPIPLTAWRFPVIRCRNIGKSVSRQRAVGRRAGR